MTTPTLTGMVAENVNVAMQAAGQNPNSIARETGIPLATLRRRLLGVESHSFKVSELELIANTLGTTVKALVDGQVAA